MFHTFAVLRVRGSLISHWQSSRIIFLSKCQARREECGTLD